MQASPCKPKRELQLQVWWVHFPCIHAPMHGYLFPDSSGIYLQTRLPDALPHCNPPNHINQQSL